MGIQSDAMFSQGDVMRRLRELDQDIQTAQRERRLEKSSIGRGGITIKDEGSIRSDNFDGDGADVLGEPGTEGWALGAAGLVVNDGVFRGEVRSANFVEGESGYQLLPNGDAELNNITLRDGVASGDIQVAAGGALEFLDASDNVVTKFGSGWQTSVSLTVTPPAEWGSYLIAAWAVQYVTTHTGSATGTNGVEVRTTIGTDNGTAQGLTDGFTTVPCGHNVKGLSGATDVLLEVQKNTPTDPGDTDAEAAWASLTYIAIRTS